MAIGQQWSVMHQILCFKAFLQRRYSAPQPPPDTVHQARYPHFNPATAAKEFKRRIRLIGLESQLLPARGANRACHVQPSLSINVNLPPIVAAPPSPPPPPLVYLHQQSTFHHHHLPHHHHHHNPMVKCMTNASGSSTSTDRCARGA